MCLTVKISTHAAPKVGVGWWVMRITPKKKKKDSPEQIDQNDTAKHATIAQLLQQQQLLQQNYYSAELPYCYPGTPDDPIFTSWKKPIENFAVTQRGEYTA